MNMHGLVLLYWVFALSEGCLLTVSYVNSIPTELDEAAFIDGCSPIRAFSTIVIPLSKALIGVMALYYGVGHWNSYFSAMIYITDRSKYPLQLILREILIENQMKADMMAAGAYVDELLLDAQVKAASLIRYAVIIVSSLPVLIIYPFLQKYFDKGVMIGSIKG